MIILIESQWNLKFFVVCCSCVCNHILIESQWNLKTRIARQINEMGIILIESQWNLKLGCILDYLNIPSDINRITVEFKTG